MRLNHLFVCLASLLVTLPAGAQITVNTLPSRVFGHLQLDVPSDHPNLVVGREFASPQGIAIDTNSNPPTLYVADTLNNRVLVWLNASAFPNGARADFVIGQPDFIYTGCGGPNLTATCRGPRSSVSGGLYNPTGLAVDSEHNLYVADSANNRVVRFPNPPAQTGDREPDLIIGQTSKASGLPNGGNSTPSPTTLRLCCDANRSPYRSSMAFDSGGNLYVADAGNHRVLRYPRGSLGPGYAPAADMVMGQPNFSTADAPAVNADSRANKDVLLAPAGVTVDRASGRLYVADGLLRVLVYTPGAPAQGVRAVRIMGISRPAQGQQLAADIQLFGPEGVVMLGNRPAVIDTTAHRIIIFPPFEQWPAETTDMPSPRALATGGLIGQSAFQLDNKANRNQPEPSSSSLANPVAAVLYNDELFVADAGNNRLLVFPQQSGVFTAASRVLGQDGFQYGSVDLIEGRELFLGTRGGIALDETSDPPHLYIADTFNHRILGFRDARRVTPGTTADLVIGQPDLRRAVQNYKTGDVTNDRLTPSQSSLSAPTGLTLDSQGNLWVADSGNGRVLRFPRPFDQTQLNLPNADLVIGQPEFTTSPPFDIVSASRMGEPYGLGFDAEYGLYVSDRLNHRVLFFPAPYVKGMPASKVFGQADFGSRESGNNRNRFNAPSHVALDSEGRLHVADTNNNRILLFGNPRAGDDTNQFAQNALDGWNRPLGVHVSLITGEIWVAETGTGRSLRFPKFQDLSLIDANPPTAVLTNSAAAPLAITLDRYGTLFIADSSNRVAMHYPVAVAVNGASFKHPFASTENMMNNFRTAIRAGTLPNVLNAYPPLAPGMIASLFPLDITLGGTHFGDQTKVFNELPNPLPLPRDLADIRLMVNGAAAPLFFVAPGQINFQMPSNAPTTGTVELRVENAKTGQILAIGKTSMAQVAPGMFTFEPTGSGPLKALNEDNTVNTAENPIARGSVIQLFGTGQGAVSNMPPDGELTQGDPLATTDTKPRVIMQPGPATFLDEKLVEFSGLTPGLVGVWQVNVRVPMEATPGPVLVVLQLKDFPSNNPQFPQQIRTTIFVKQ